jgi:hypothetical protein
MTFRYKYGSFTHEAGSVTDFRWQTIPHYTQRGKVDVSLYRITLTGELICTDGDNWQDIRDKIYNLRSAYLVNGLPFALINPDNTLSSYNLDPTYDEAIVNGPYVTDIDFPTGTIEEMVVKREWKVVLECLRLEPESLRIEYEERIRHLGTCAESWAYAPVWTGLLRKYQTRRATTQMVVQEGRSVGLTGYYLPGYVSPGWPTYPSLPGWPTWPVPSGGTTFGVPAYPPIHEHLESREETLGKPLRLGRYFLYYPANWRYHYEVPSPLLIQPA